MEAKIEFPRDHGSHSDFRFEWKYFWGRNSDGIFYHVATFRKDGKRFHHTSLNGVFEEPSELDVRFPEDRLIMEHDSKMWNCYSLPGNPWYDHVWGENAGSNWDWVGVILDDGTFIMAQEKEDDRMCDFTLGNRIFKSEFSLSGERLDIWKLGMCLFLEPLKEEVIFRPKLGRDYSETPFNIVANGKVIGFGMRERTYRNVNL